jgi:23S rRNA pseudouridine2605 synthase
MSESEEYSPAGEKLQKVMARMGLASRREIEAWISAGRVKVNGAVASLGMRVDLHDAIAVDGKVLRREESAESVRRVIIYNKPEGEICTRDDPEGRPTVFDRLPRPKEGRWINIGRLDINTTGLLMFTTDGELANRLMHPSYQMDREYAVRVRGEVDEEMIERLKTGVMLEDGPAKFTDIKEAPGGEGFNHWYHCVVMEGRNREVRRLWESQGLVVSRLKRVRFGPVFITSDLKEKTRDKLDRLQRKSAKPVGRAARPERTLRPAHGAPSTGADQGRSRPVRNEGGERPTRSPRADQGKGTPVAERPSDVNKKRPAKPGAQRPGVELSDRPARKPAGAPVKRRSQPGREGQRPGFGRDRKPE